VEPTQYPLFVAAALTEKTEAGYVLNEPLLSKLVTREQYLHAIDTLIGHRTLWTFAPEDRQAAAAYQVALDGSSSSSSSTLSQPSNAPEEPELGSTIPEDQTKRVVEGWATRMNTVKSDMAEDGG
jgi:hypothetical protein